MVLQTILRQLFCPSRQRFSPVLPITNITEVKPLPSLDYKLIVGNSSVETLDIEELVRRLLDLRGEGPEAEELEQELNERVYELFGLTREEVRLVEDRLDL